MAVEAPRLYNRDTFPRAHPGPHAAPRTAVDRSSMAHGTDYNRQLKVVATVSRLPLPLPSSVCTVLSLDSVVGRVVGMVVGVECSMDAAVVAVSDKFVPDAERVHRPCTLDQALTVKATASDVVLAALKPSELSCLRQKPSNSNQNRKEDDAG